MGKVDLKKNSVAFFDHPNVVDEPGFYVLEGEKTTSDVKVYDNGSFATVDEDGEQVLVTDERGRPQFHTTPEHVDTISVKHETQMTPGKRVWSHPEGDGFVTEAPEETNEDDWGAVSNGG